MDFSFENYSELVKLFSYTFVFCGSQNSFVVVTLHEYHGNHENIKMDKKSWLRYATNNIHFRCIGKTREAVRPRKNWGQELILVIAYLGSKINTFD